MKRIEIKIELIEKDDGGLVLKNREFFAEINPSDTKLIQLLHSYLYPKPKSKKIVILKR
jgi:hypothetical protein